MRNVKNLVYLILILATSCKKDDNGSTTGTFIIDYNSKKYTTYYVNTPIPSTNGKFSLQYSKPSSGSVSDVYKYQFFILIDNNNNAYLDVWTPTLITNGTSYVSNSAQKITVNFGATINNADLPIAKSTVTFTSSSYPGRIAGSVKSFNANGLLICTSNFDFVSQ